MEFLTHRCQVLEAIAKPPMPLVTNHNRPKPRQALSSQVTTSILACPICKESHQLYKCERFRKMPVRDRVSEARKKGLCLNCLRSTNHFAIECNASRCKVCNRKHNTLLHTQSEPSQGSTAVANERGESDSEAAVANIGRGLKAASHREALLLTAKVKLLDANGKPITVRALLDSGSQVNIITRNLAQRLRLQSKEFRAPIAGIGQMTTQPLHQIEVVLKSNYNNYRRKIDCVILNSITKKLPAVSMDGNKLAIPGNIRLADPAFYESANIDVLLGIEVYLEILCTGQIKATRSHPTLQKTQLGWVVGGCLRDVKGSPKEVACNIATQVQDVDQLVSRFWELDNVADVHPLTEQERYCEEHFKRTYRRDADGRFVVRLPIIEEKIVSLQDNRTAALNRFFSLERKLAKNPTLRDAYSSFIKEYRDLEHMRTLPEDKATPLSTYYIPHHAILNEKSATTKLRVVFDASAKSKSGISLNDALAIGPNIQDDLFSIIARFRTYAYVITADIQKMYRQIRVDESQVSLQKIFWRDDVRNPVSTCELLTLTYGTASASFLATRCLKEIADLEEGNHPIGAQVIRRDFYVDDLLTGADSIAEVREIRDQVNQVLAKAGFKLHKWAANSGKILPHIPEKVDSKQILNLNKEGDIRALGVLWDPSDDSFQYSVPIAAPVHRITKRVILASVAKVFDPLGLIGPVTVTGKVIIQRLWQRGIHWDESIPMDLETAWLHYAKQLPVLNDIRVERKTICKNAKEIEMHGFADASETAYGACIYIVSKDGRGNGSSNLLCARSRVAPLKAVSLPRLELCATVLLARMINKLTTNMRVEFRKICCWSDSTIALAWIRAPSRNWTTFVANRVAEIQERIPNAKWGHVSSAENPADFISRGVTPTELLSLDLWWHGPGMVFGNATDTAPEVPLEELPERRNTSVTCTVAMIGRDQRSREFCDRIFNKYSQFTRLVRVIAYCGRFCRNARRAQTKDIGPLTVAEIAQARERLIKLCQAQEFGEEIRAITKNPRIIVHGRLACLKPFLDTNGIMRVGGRLQNADIAYGNKYPIVLPRSHKLTALIIQHEHIKNFHAGPQLTLAAVRENYWPMAGRSTVRGIIRRCVVCFKNAPMNSRYVMGNLPESRVTPSRPFTNTGVDYCGPFLVKEGRRRNAKYVKAYAKAKISDQLSIEGVAWHYIPPGAPNFGGLWEAAVKAAKYHLRRVCIIWINSFRPYNAEVERDSSLFPIKVRKRVHESVHSTGVGTSTTVQLYIGSASWINHTKWSLRAEASVQFLDFEDESEWITVS
ncbi:uncharacterized protein LOC122526416 [Polistes fuscatus]|uniref:uncharacterized protein LOC122526416 n=1 Tax=Polistes fuscatus TaxID=30207 RepID=UPI001CA87C1B|nr:uncharacterized protein LOC122526416 [Polistes fuscatus]